MEQRKASDIVFVEDGERNRKNGKYCEVSVVVDMECGDTKRN